MIGLENPVAPHNPDISPLAEARANHFKIDFAADVTAFRCWMTTMAGKEGADAIEGTFRVVEAEPAYMRLSDEAKRTMELLVQASIKALRAA